MVIQNQNLVRIRKQIMLVYLCWGKEENSNLRFLRCPTIPMEEYLESWRSTLGVLIFVAAENLWIASEAKMHLILNEIKFKVY